VKKRPYGQPRAVGDILRGVLRGLSAPDSGEAGQVRALWPEIVGNVTAAKTRIGALEDGTLTVEVESSALKHHLSTFLSGEILEALGKKLPGLRIRSIRYRVGKAR
jgi:hypothetical protein